jgi:L,D-transpeptidase YcbB
MNTATRLLYTGPTRSVRRLVLAWLVVVPLSAVAAPVNDSIHAQLASIQAEPAFGPLATAAEAVIPALYARRDYAPVWSNPESVRQLVDAITHSDADGLDPADYHLAAIHRFLEHKTESELPGPEQSAYLDLLLTDSLVRLSYHLAFGKVDPRTLDADWSMPGPAADLEALLLGSHAIDNGRIDELLQSLRPHSPRYEQLRQALAQYREYRDRGGWQTVAPGPALKPGMTDARIPVLRTRLAATGDLHSNDLQSTLYDEALIEAVQHFQRRHGLDADGVTGDRTLAALNVPVAARIDQVRANLERARWVLRNLPDDYIMVDIADFTVRLVEHRQVVWETRAIVGQPLRKSPVLRSTLAWLDINPTWTVPPIVLARDVLPELRRNPGYLQQKHMQVIDYRGNPIDTNGIDWSRYNSHNFPWLIRQQPGPQNALGQIKFMFPNSHSVYLHDTPSRSLFSKTERAFSSGCIRIEHPLELAERLLQNNAGWDRARLQGAVKSLTTRSVTLSRPVDIFLMYWTVEVGEDGTVQFSQDIYARDPALIQSLDHPLDSQPHSPTQPEPALTALR